MRRITGLFLGAGASYEAGMPLAWELTAELKDWLTAGKLRELNEAWKVQHSGHPDEVINDLSGILARPEVHYEAALGFMETQYRRQRQHALGQHYHGLYSWLVEMVYHLLYFRQVNNNAFLQRRLSDYEGLRALAESSAPLWVFSLNHDVMIEAIAARLSIPLHTGFSPQIVTLPRRNGKGQKTGEIRGEVLTKQDLDKHAMYFPNPPQPGIYLLKIHGALDVFAFNDGNDLLKLLPDRSGQEAVIDVLRAANEDLLYLIPGATGGKAKATNEIAYADDQGIMQFLRRTLLAGAFKFDARASQVLPKCLLRHFAENLNFVSDLVCIGYSFGDLHINTILRDWLDFTPDRRLEIVSPDSTNIPSFLLHLAPQITLTRSCATDYLDTRAGIVRQRQAQLEKRLCAVTRSIGKERTNKVLAEFIRKDQLRATQEFRARLASLPVIDGRPDFASIGDAVVAGRRWGAEIKLNNEDFLDGFLKSVEEERNLP